MVHRKFFSVAAYYTWVRWECQAQIRRPQGCCVLHDGQWNCEVIHKTGTFGAFEITGITGVSFCDATFRMPVIAVIGIPLHENDHLMTQNPYYPCQYYVHRLTIDLRI